MNNKDSAVLIIAHGSRQKSTEKTLEYITERVKTLLPERKIRLAFMEFGERTIEGELEKLAAEGEKTILAAPYFLFDGMHLRVDIPEVLAKFSGAHPDITAQLCKPLGTDDRLADIMVDRILGGA